MEGSVGGGWKQGNLIGEGMLFSNAEVTHYQQEERRGKQHVKCWLYFLVWLFSGSHCTHLFWWYMLNLLIHSGSSFVFPGVPASSSFPHAVGKFHHWFTLTSCFLFWVWTDFTDLQFGIWMHTSACGCVLSSLPMCSFICREVSMSPLACLSNERQGGGGTTFLIWCWCDTVQSVNSAGQHLPCVDCMCTTAGHGTLVPSVHMRDRVSSYTVAEEGDWSVVIPFYCMQLHSFFP